jgi:ubiquitin fusion degradation protein 1
MFDFGFAGGAGGYGGGGFGGQNMVFEEQYHCYSSAVSGRSNLETGDKILLPPSALDTLARMNVEYPMLFELTNTTLGLKSHCGTYISRPSQCLTFLS